MKNLSAIVLFMLLLFSIGCQNHKQANPLKEIVFPGDWIGTYEGTMDLFNAEKGKTMSLPMRLVIKKTDAKNRYVWRSKAIYKGKEIIKDYNLITADSMPKNHFLMDENNGIFLDRVLLDDAFYDYFEVGGKGFFGISRKLGNDIHFEIASFNLKSRTHSIYKGTEFNVDTVSSFKVDNTQKVLLKRVK